MPYSIQKRYVRFQKLESFPEAPHVLLVQPQEGCEKVAREQGWGGVVVGMREGGVRLWGQCCHFSK